MTFQHTKRIGKFSLALACLAVVCFAIGLAEAQEDHPAFGRVQRSTLKLEAEVWPPDATAEQIAAAIAKIESAAVTAIRRTNKPLVQGKRPTAAQARDMLRVQVGIDAGGKPIYKTDLQLCLDWIAMDQLGRLKVATVTGTVIEAGHPEPQQ